MKIDYLISELLEYAVERNLIDDSDRAYATARLISLFKLSDFEECKTEGARELSEILSDLCDFAHGCGLIEENSVVFRDLFDTEVMGIFVERPSGVIERFYSLYKDSPEK